MTNCREFCTALDAFVDGELAVERAVDVECHISSCPDCAQRVRFERAFRASIKRVVREQVGSTATLQERLARVLVAERMKQPVNACTSIGGVTESGVSVPRWTPTPPDAQVRHGLQQRQAKRSMGSSPPAVVLTQHRGAMRWRTLLPLAAVAAGAIIYAGTKNQPAATTSWHHVRTNDLKLSELDSYLDLMVNRHRAASRQPLPLTFSHDERLEPPYRLPPMVFSPRPAHPTRSTSSGIFHGDSSGYQVRGHKVTFFAYQAAAAPLRARLVGRSIRGHVVYTGSRHGLSVATVEDGPIGYAVTSDMRQEESADLIASALESRVQH